MKTEQRGQNKPEQTVEKQSSCGGGVECCHELLLVLNMEAN
jgi:hypothetical protein